MELNMTSGIYADFNNADAQGRLRLNCVGTMNDLARNNIQLRRGLKLLFYSDDVDSHGRQDKLLVEGVVVPSEVENGWVATIDWNAVRHRSDRAAGVER